MIRPSRPMSPMPHIIPCMLSIMPCILSRPRAVVWPLGYAPAGFRARQTWLKSSIGMRYARALMGFYAQHLFPSLLHFAMMHKSLRPYRQRVAAEAAGRVLEIG